MPFEVVRDPLWNNIRLEGDALAVIDTPPFQRLRYVRQLGHAFLVYPGATHTRFEHALGTYHLARRALAALDERGHGVISPAERMQVQLAALLHDVGHYPFSHALEEAGLPHHEELAAHRLGEESLHGRLKGVVGVGGTAEIVSLIRGRSAASLAGLISGSLDLDKIEYLTRDAWMCGVPYGAIDVDRLLASLCLIEGPDRGQVKIGVHEKGLSALESLLFSKYQMFRNVYWHHAVRAATCMFKRVVRDAIASGHLSVEAIAVATDDGLLHEVLGSDRTGLGAALRERRLHKRAIDIPSSEIPESDTWIARDPELLARAEDQLATEIGAAPGAVLLDYPEKPGMLAVDLPLRRRDGRVEHLTEAGQITELGLPKVAEELYQSARRFRVFVREPERIDADAWVALASMTATEIRRRLAVGRPLLG